MPTRRRAPQWGVSRWLGALLSSAFLAHAVWAAAPPPAPEYEVKAAFLYNLAVLTEWPTNALPQTDTLFVIGVLGADPFGPALERVLAGKKVAGRALRFVRVARVEEVWDCQILFVSAGEAERWPAIQAALAKRPVLTVSDMDRFCQRGGMVRLVKRPDETIGLHVNLEAAKQGKLKLSSRLLTLAHLQKTAR